MSSWLKDLREVFGRLLLVALVMILGYFGPVVAIYFPYDTGFIELEPLGEDVNSKNYYEQVYSKRNGAGEESSPDYVNYGRRRGEETVDDVTDFVERYRLQNARTLEVGAGSGQLQDIVADYTGLDIAATAASNFHKPFVEGSALDLPFEQNEFDAIWTVFTLEHVPDPEKALEEIRRVGKPGAMVFLFPAWNCASWFAPGYGVRPYENFSWTEKLAKASLAIRDHPLFRFSHVAPIRVLRYAQSQLSRGPQRFRYSALRPNYTTYWLSDSDAVAAFDAVEAMIWFESRGDECLNCPATLMELLFLPFGPLHIRLAEKNTGDSASGIRGSDNSL